MDLSLETTAIHVVRDYLVGLLHQEAWCKARQVGQALEILVGIRNQGPGTATEEGRGKTNVKQEDLRTYLERGR